MSLSLHVSVPTCLCLYMSLSLHVSVPVELLLQQVQSVVQLGALPAADIVERGGGWQAAARQLLVLTTAPTLPPETEDI